MAQQGLIRQGVSWDSLCIMSKNGDQELDKAYDDTSYVSCQNTVVNV